MFCEITNSFGTTKNNHYSWWGFCLSWACTSLVHAVKTAVNSYVQLFCCSWKALSLCNHPLPLPSTNSFTMMSEVLVEGGVIEMFYLRSDHSTISYSLYLGKLWVFVFIDSYFKKKLFWCSYRDAWSMDIKISQSNGLIFSLQQNNNNGFSHRLCELDSYRFLIPIVVPYMCWSFVVRLKSNRKVLGYFHDFQAQVSLSLLAGHYHSPQFLRYRKTNNSFLPILLFFHQ